MGRDKIARDNKTKEKIRHGSTKEAKEVVEWWDTGGVGDT